MINNIPYEPDTMIRRTKKAKSYQFDNAMVNPLHIQRELNKRSFFEFFKYFWDTISNDELIINWHIQYLCDEVLLPEAYRVINNEPRIYDIVINIPPGTTKTILISIMFPVWVWTLDVTKRFITASYTSALSYENADMARELIKSDKFLKMYPDIRIQRDRDVKSNYRILSKMKYSKHGPPIIKRGGYRYSTSVGGTLTGFHGHFLIVDDPLDPKKALSDVELKKANRWMSQTLASRKTDKKVTSTILLMQRLHENDPSGYLLKTRKGRIHHISLPGEIRNYKEFLKPQSLTKYYLNDMFDIRRMGWSTLKEMEADLGQYAYAGQIGQNPAPPGGGMFKVGMFQIINHIGDIDIKKIVRYWDKAGTLNAGAFTAGVKIASLTSGKFLILDVRRGQWESLQRERTILSTAVADTRKCVIYHEQEPGSGGKESAQATTRMLAGFKAHADRPVGDKVYRADPYSVQVNAGNVLLMRGDWNDTFIKEHESFPFGTYKDQVDAAAAGFNKITAKKRAGAAK